MASLPNSKTVTYEEWLRMPEVSDAIEEVVNGEIRIMPAPKWNHGEVVESLQYSLNSQLDRRTFRVVATNFGLIICKSPLTSRVPDLAVFERSTIIEQDGYIHSAPQLVVEVLYLEDGFLHSTQILARGVLTPRLFPAVSIDIAHIWPD